nr:hypothetical protein [Staphylococcus arlettae]
MLVILAGVGRRNHFFKIRFLSHSLLDIITLIFNCRFHICDFNLVVIIINLDITSC